MEILLAPLGLGGAIIAILICMAFGIVLEIIELALRLVNWLVRKGDDIFRCWRYHRRKA